MAYSKIILNGETLMDVTSDTVDAGNLLSGKTATKNSGAKVTGNIASKSSSDLTASGATVTAPAGYYSTAASKAVTTTTHPNPTAAIASSTGVVTATHTQGTGYVTGGTTTGTLNLTTQAAQTINTSTADQTIASNRWLTGTQTIKSVTTSNLTAANIANGVTVKVGDSNNASRISQVTGTYAPATSSLTVTPTETAQTFNATGVYGYKPVTINAISSTYVGTGITTRSAANITFSGSKAIIPSGYYSSGVSSAMGEATINGYFSLTSSTGKYAYGYSTTISGYAETGTGGGGGTLTIQAAQTIYPSTATQYVNSYRWLTGSQTIASVTTTNLTAANIAEGVVVKVGDANNASRITQITGTHSGGGKHKIKITQAGANAGSGVVYNNIPHYELNEEFYVTDGDTITIVCAQGFNNNYIYVDGELVKSGTGGSTALYDLVVSSDIDVKLGNSYNSTGYVYVYEYVNPTDTSLSITSNGTYNVYSYAKASVNVGGGEYYDAYKNIALKMAISTSSSIYSSVFQSFFNNISSITNYMFAQISMSGSFSFSNCTYIASHAFEHTEYNTCGVCCFDFPEVLAISSYAFHFQSRMTAISAPKCQQIGSAAFESCYSLSTAAFPNCSYIGYLAFNSCSNLTTVSFLNCSTIGVSAFYNCYSLTSVNFPNCSAIGSYAFYSCSNLTTVSFPALNYIYSGVFGRCSKLEIVNIPNCKIISEYAFYNCSGLISVDFPSCSWISYSAFTNCTGLTSVNFPNCSAIGSYAFSSCIHLISISFPNCSYVGASAFFACYSLRTADFSTCSTIYGSAFYSCYSLSTAKFPNCTSFGANAFRYCFNLISFYLNNVSSVPTFGANMFLSTPISNYSTSAGRYGSIFVPSSLYTEFTTALSWSVYSARMVSV